MTINSTPINTVAINGDSDPIISGEIVAIEQNVVRLMEGELVAIEQNVNYAAQMFGEIAAIAQNTSATVSGELVSIQQNVVDYSVGKIASLGWDLSIFIDNKEVDPSLVVTSVKIKRSESRAALAEFTLLGEPGVQDYEALHGKNVTIDCHTLNGTYRIYTGIIDIPDVNLNIERAKIQCTDRREELLNNLGRNTIDAIGYYSPIIFDEPESQAEEVEQRLSTTPYSVDFDAYGQFTITPWQPKTVPDYTFVDEDIYRFEPKVKLASRGRLINRVEIDFKHRFERFYQQGVGYSWVHPMNNLIGLYLVDGYSLTTREMVRQAASNAGWYIPGNRINFIDIHPNGWYNVNGTKVLFTTTQTRGETVAVLDEEGNQLSDSDGNPLYETRITGGTDYSKVFCMGASWTAYKRWAQTVTESYNLVVESPQSINQYGTIKKTQNYAFDEPADSSEWEGAKAFPIGSGFNGIHDQDLQRSNFANAVNVALQKARNTIEGSHRDTRVTFQTTEIRPELDLIHTLEVSSDELDCKGKIEEIEHNFNIKTGEAKTTVTLVLSRAEGSTSTTPLQYPGKISDSLTPDIPNPSLGNHFGEDPEQPQAVYWTGMIGNRWIQANNNIWRTNYVEQFRVDTPKIPENVRKGRDLNLDVNYNISLRNDPLTITFDGKY